MDTSNFNGLPFPMTPVGAFEAKPPSRHRLAAEVQQVEYLSVALSRFLIIVFVSIYHDVNDRPMTIKYSI
jgi:hypothetical protein